MKTYQLIPISLAVLFVLSSCSQKSGEKYIPEFTEGQKRLYSFQISAALQGGRVSTGVGTISIEGKTDIQGEKYFREIFELSGLPGGLPLTTTRYVRQDKNGIHAIDASDNTQTEYTDVPFPIKPGNKWTVDIGSGATTYTIGAAERVDVLGRTYLDCLKVSYTGARGAGFYYLAPGTGDVKGEINQNGISMTYQLVKQF